MTDPFHLFRSMQIAYFERFWSTVAALSIGGFVSMKRFFTFMAIGLFLSSGLHAENRLFPTDILNEGEVDAQLTVASTRVSTDIQSYGSDGHSSSRINSESAGVRYGLGARWHVGAQLNYRSREVYKTDYDNPPQRYRNSSSNRAQNPSLWVKYGFTEPGASPLTLSGQLLVSPDTTGRQETFYQGVLSSGWKSGETLRLFGVVSASASNGSDAANTGRVSVGAYKIISDDLTLIPSIGYVRYRETDRLKSSTQQNIALAAQIRLARNTYLTPLVAFFRNGSGGRRDVSLDWSATSNGLGLELSLSHLF